MDEDDLNDNENCFQYITNRVKIKKFLDHMEPTMKVFFKRY